MLNVRMIEPIETISAFLMLSYPLSKILSSRNYNKNERCNHNF